MILFQASLFSNMLTGMYYFGRRYKLSKYLSVAMVSIGVIICTIASGKEIKCCDTVVKVNCIGDLNTGLFRYSCIIWFSEWSL